MLAKIGESVDQQSASAVTRNGKARLRATRE